MALHRAKKGLPAVALGAYFRIMTALQLQDDFNLLAKDDVLGRRLEDIALSKTRRHES